MSCPRTVKILQATEGGKLRRRGRTGRLLQDGFTRASWRPDPASPGGVRVTLHRPEPPPRPALREPCEHVFEVDGPTPGRHYDTRATANPGPVLFNLMKG